MKYRIKEINHKHGARYYKIQSRFLFVWADFNPHLGTYHYNTLSQAKVKLKELKELKDSKMVDIKYHY